MLNLLGLCSINDRITNTSALHFNLYWLSINVLCQNAWCHILVGDIFDFSLFLSWRRIVFQLARESLAPFWLGLSYVPCIHDWLFLSAVALLMCVVFDWSCIFLKRIIPCCILFFLCDSCWRPLLCVIFYMLPLVLL